jgi:hypothetical protein
MFKIQSGPEANIHLRMSPRKFEMGYLETGFIKLLISVNLVDNLFSDNLYITWKHEM